MPSSRRKFFRDLGGYAVTTGVGWQALQTMVPASAEDAKVTPNLVQFRPEMEEIVRWIERTPREQILNVAAENLRRGLGYRQLMGGLFLAGIRNIKPRPVGFKFHAVLVINAAHQLSLDAPQADRLIPFFWALDNFKSSQAQDVKEGDWSLSSLNESAVPKPSQSLGRFHEAMQKWDDEAADVAIAGLCRSAGAAEVIESLWTYAIRDWQNIGHKAIFAAHAWRTLDVIGWEHAEPVLRSLVYGLLNGGPTESAAPYGQNQQLLSQIRPDWKDGKADSGATSSLLQTLRTANTKEAATAVEEHLNQGISANSIWDAILLAGSELLMRQQAIVPLHATTATNSMYYIFRQCSRDETRLHTLLQAASWITLFREGAKSRGNFPESLQIDQFAAAETAPANVSQIFETMQTDRHRAAAQALAYARAGSDPVQFFDAARHLIFAKGTDAHDFKYAAAAFEDLQYASAGIRPQLLAATAYYLKGPSDKDSPLLQKTREVLAMR